MVRRHFRPTRAAVIAGSVVTLLTFSSVPLKAATHQIRRIEGATLWVRPPMVAERWSGKAVIPATVPPKIPIFDGHFPGFAEAKRHANEIRRRAEMARASARVEGSSAQPASASTVIFGGPDQASTNEIPPDSQVASGPNNLVVVVNSLIAIYDKSGNPDGSYQPLSSFFASLGVIGEIFDPRVVYDQASGRFILSAGAVDFANFSSGDVVLAISATSDPTGVWYKYAIDSMGTSSTGQATFPDFPTLGTSSSAVYISTSQFELNSTCLETDEQNCRFSDTWITAIGFAPLLAGGGALNVTTFKNVQTPAGGAAFAIEPAVTYGTAPEEFLVAADFGSLASANSAIVDVFAINTTGTPVLSSTTVKLPSPVSLPPNALQPGAQPGGAVVPIDTDDIRLLGAVWMNGSVWCAQNVASSDGSSAVARWYQLAATSLASVSITQSGTIAGSGDAYYPAIAVQSDGDAVVAFTTSNANQNPSAAYTGRSASDAPGTMRGFGIFKPGAGTYSFDDDSRWGDYSGASLDPSGSSIWLMGEFVKLINSYGTSIAQINGPPAVVSSEASVDFGDQLIGATTPAQTVTMTNPGPSPAVFGSLTLGGQNASDFAIAGDACSNATLAAGASCEVKLTFTPSVDAGESDELSVPTTGVGIPQIVLLTGTGVTASQALGISPASLTFSSQAIRSVSAPQTVTITNLVKSPITILSVSAPFQFAETNTCVPSVESRTLAPGATCTISVTFRPTQTGAVSSEVSVNLLAQGGGVAVPVAGTGVEAPAATLCPTEIQFGSQTVGTTSAPQTLNISNTGSSPLTISAVTVTAGFSAGPTCGPGTSIPPRTACSVTVTFTPAAPGNIAGTLSVTDNAGDSPQTVALQGTGLAASSALELPIAAMPLVARNPVGRFSAVTHFHVRSKPEIANVLAQLPLSFQPNARGTNPRFAFLSRNAGYTLFLAPDRAFLAFTPKQHVGAHGLGSFVALGLAGSDPGTTLKGEKPLRTVNNYFIGNDPAKWRLHVPAFAQVRSQGIYKGIDMVYYGRRGRLEYDFAVAPHANPRVIRMELRFHDPALLSRDSGRAAPSMLIGTPEGGIEIGRGESVVLLAPPLAYQQDRKDPHANRRIRCRYVIRRRRIRGSSLFALVTFRLGAYDHRAPLIIDPVLSYSTFLGGSGGDVANAIALDGAGDVFVAGMAGSFDFPVAGALEPRSLGAEAFVTKLSPDGSHVLYSTYLGGTGDDAATGVALDSAGDIFVTGTTQSKNFPLVNAFQTAYRGNQDAFVAKISADGSKLLYSSYLGGSQLDSAAGIAVDAAGNAYIAGSTASADFPTTPGAFETVAESTGSPACNRGDFQDCPSNAFVVKIAPNGTLSYSTYLSGHQNDGASGIAVDSAGDAYVVGTAGSDDFPVTPGAYQTAAAALSDAFVTKLSPDGTHLLYSTYLGGGPQSVDSVGGGSSGSAIAIDSNGSVYVTGTTESSDFPITASSGTTSPGTYTFVTKLHPAGCALDYSYKFYAILPEAMALDSQGDAYVVGTAQEDTDLANPIQSSCVKCQEGASKAFISEINSSGTALAFSTYLGGDSAEDQGRAIAVDGGGNIFVAGETASADFPVLPGAFQVTKPSQGLTGFVAKIGPANAAAAYVIPSSLTFSNQPVNSTSPPQQIDIRDMGSGPLTVSNVTLPAGFSQTNSCNPTPGGGVCAISVTFSPTSASTVNGAMTITDNTPTSPHTIALAANGVNAPYVVLSPSPLNFGNQPFGVLSAPQTATLSNTGDQPLDISGIAIADARVSPFSQTNNCPSALAAGASCQFTITFTPQSIEPAFDDVVISDNAAGSPHYLDLEGTGTGAILYVLTGISGFGNQHVGTASAPQIMTLANDGNAPAQIKSIGITGDFGETTTCSLTAQLPVGGQCTLSITFTPTAAGLRTGSVTITSNSIDGPLTVPLSATGVVPDFNLSASPTMPSVPPGGTAGFNLTIAATGGLTGPISLACSGAPALATCTVQPATVTVGGTGQASAVVNVVTTAPSLGTAPGRIPPASGPGPSFPGRWIAALLALLLVLLCAVARPKRPFVQAAAFACILLFALVWASCGGSMGGGGGGSTGVGNPGTPAGTYSLVVTATYAGSSPPLAHSVTLTLVVQ